MNVKQLYKAYEFGASLRALAAELGTTTFKVAKAFREHGFPLRGRGRPSTELKVGAAVLKRDLKKFRSGKVQLKHLAQDWGCACGTAARIVAQQSKPGG